MRSRSCRLYRCQKVRKKRHPPELVRPWRTCSEAPPRDPRAAVERPFEQSGRRSECRSCLQEAKLATETKFALRLKGNRRFGTAKGPKAQRLKPARRFPA